MPSFETHSRDGKLPVGLICRVPSCTYLRCILPVHIDNWHVFEDGWLSCSTCLTPKSLSVSLFTDTSRLEKLLITLSQMSWRSVCSIPTRVSFQIYIPIFSKRDLNFDYHFLFSEKYILYRRKLGRRVIVEYSFEYCFEEINWPMHFLYKYIRTIV